MVAQAAGAPRVLLIEDHQDILRATTRLLNIEGFEITPCHTAAHAETALVEAEQHHESAFQLVVSDWILEQDNAAGLVEHACRMNIPVLIVTGTPTKAQEWLQQQASPNVRAADVQIVTKGHDWSWIEKAKGLIR